MLRFVGDRIIYYVHIVHYSMFSPLSVDDTYGVEIEVHTSQVTHPHHDMSASGFAFFAAHNFAVDHKIHFSLL